MTDGSQTAVGLVVKLPFATREEVLAKYGSNVSRGGIYLRSRTVKPPGTAVTLELRLASGERLIHASARVEFTTGQAGSGVSGMGLRFLVVDPATQRFLESAASALANANTLEVPLPLGVGDAQYGPSGRDPASAPPEVRDLSQPGAAQTHSNGAAPGAVQRAAIKSGAASRPSPARPASDAPVHVSAPARADGTAAPALHAPAFQPAEEPKRAGPIIGIDLGTTNSCAAFVRGGKPMVLASREGYNTVPSIIALNARGQLVVGHPARGQMLTNPRSTVYGAKRLVGRAYDSPVVQSVKERFHYEIAPGESGEAAVKLGDRVYSLQQISALILREVRDVARNQIGQDISRAVITVPAYYNDNQRQAVREAGRLAGLHVERILNEPTAAALAFGYGRELKQRILVYDLGGGTFDASVLELNSNIYEVISTGGDTFLGGIDFDTAIVGWLLAEFEKKTGKKFQGDRVAMQRVLDAAERAKCALSERSECRVHVPFVTIIDGHPFDLDLTLTREKVFELTDPLVERTLKVCQEVLAARKLTPKDIDEVILVGGQSRFPLVHLKVEKFFGKPPAKSVHADEAVALGAALLAYSLDQVEGVVLIDVLPMAIGVGLPGGRFKPILERNTRLPAKKTYTLATSRDDQPELELVLFQGDSTVAQENEYLGTLKLGDLPRGPRGSVSISVTFELTEEALLKVTAQEKRTGKAVTSTFSTRDTPEALRAKLQSDGGNGAQPLGDQALSEESGAAMPSPEAVAAAEKPGGFMRWIRRLFRGS
ncbi:MAG TPA: TIGR02266 family protein [Myxococcaceae bacterium]|nr:TIGR02266 family protein [Myxococcaceae bacterium]